MKKNNRYFGSLLIIFLVLFSGFVFAYGQSEITIEFNYDEVSFPDAKPYMDAEVGRVLVPVRFISEQLGAEVKWDADNMAVNIIKDGTNLGIKIGEKSYTVNGIRSSMDTEAFIKDGRTFVPIRFISEGLDVDVEWNQETYTVSLEDPNYKNEFIIQGIKLGTTEEELISKLGGPSRKDLSKYGFEWYVYNKDYSNYIQIGVKNGKVVGIYSNADNWESTNGIKVGMGRKEVEHILGESLKNIKKGNTLYSIYNVDEKGLYLIDGSYVSIYYDIHNRNSVTSVQIIDKHIELGLDDYYGTYSERLRESFENQIFDLANVIRVRNDLEPFKWSDKAKTSSRKHSQDMANNNFFDHINLISQSPSDRMENESINYELAAENIAAGTSDAIESHEGWMNSVGHRNNILGECEFLGVGVSYNASSMYQYYYTQNFFTEM